MSQAEIDAFIAQSIVPSEPSVLPEVIDIDPQVAYVVRELRSILNGDINKLKIMIAVHQGVLIMRRVKVSGAQKKIILSRALYSLVDQSNMSDDDKLASHMLLDLGMGDAIDSLVFMASGAVKMKFGMFSCCS